MRWWNIIGTALCETKKRQLCQNCVDTVTWDVAFHSVSLCSKRRKYQQVSLQDLWQRGLVALPCLSNNELGCLTLLKPYPFGNDRLGWRLDKTRSISYCYKLSGWMWSTVGKLLAVNGEVYTIERRSQTECSCLFTLLLTLIPVTGLEIVRSDCSCRSQPNPNR